jgi:hypothetical protein
MQFVCRIPMFIIKIVLFSGCILVTCALLAAIICYINQNDDRKYLINSSFLLQIIVLGRKLRSMKLIVELT